MATSDFQCEASTLEPGVKCLTLVGEVDLAVAPELKRALDEIVGAGRTKLVVDLSDATFIDSTSLGILLQAFRDLRARRGRLAVVCPDPIMRGVFELTGHNLVFPVDETLDRALIHLGAGRRFGRRRGAGRPQH